MIGLRCFECDRQYTLPDHYAGKKTRCRCGAAIRVPATAPAVSTPSVPSTCSHCLHAVQPNWKVCPSCARPLTSGDLPSRSTEIGAGDDCIIKAAIDQSNHIHVAGDVTLSPNSIGRQPSIQAGAGSVVKAEIDASQHTSAAGDLVTHKKVYNTHQESHVHQYESAVGAVVRGFLNRPGRVPLRENILFVVCCVVLCWPFGLLLLILHPNVSRRIKWGVGGVFAAIFLFAMAFATTDMVTGHSRNWLEQRERNNNQVKTDVQKLIHEGRFGEARIRAQALDSTFDAERLIKSIDKAEQSQKKN